MIYPSLPVRYLRSRFSPSPSLPSIILRFIVIIPFFFASSPVSYSSTPLAIPPGLAIPKYKKAKTIPIYRLEVKKSSPKKEDNPKVQHIQNAKKKSSSFSVSLLASLSVQYAILSTVLYTQTTFQPSSSSTSFFPSQAQETTSSPRYSNSRCRLFFFASLLSSHRALVGSTDLS